MSWRGEKMPQKNFFFDPSSFERARAALAGPLRPEEIDFWAPFYGAGFDNVITIRSRDGRQTIASGRLVRRTRGETSFDGDRVVMRKVFLFGDDGEVREVAISDVTDSAQITITRREYEVPETRTRIESNAELATRAGIPSLKRIGKLQGLVDFVRREKMVPVPLRDRAGTTWNEAVYMSLEMPNEERLFQSAGSAAGPEDELVWFRFSNELLNDREFWINPGWDIGQYSAASLLGPDPNFRRALWLHARHRVWGKHLPELVFVGDVPLRALIEIVVRPGRKPLILDYLRSHLTLSQFESLSPRIIERP